MARLLFSVVPLCILISIINAFHPVTEIRSRRLLPKQSRRLLDSFGPNPEIWPPTNEEPSTLSDSFPGGVIPDRAMLALQSNNGKRSLPANRRRRLSSIFRWKSVSDGRMSCAPAILASGLLLSGYTRPLDILLVSFLTGYSCLLGVVAKSIRSDGLTPTLPALPPQGFVPSIVANPLGYSFACSGLYSRWLQLGLVLGIVAPFALIVKGSIQKGQAALAAHSCARSAFLLCCQAFSESVSRRLVTPLPLRIFIPVAYNTVRIGYLWQWVSLSGLGIERGLSILNFAYWSLNLFGFLLPVAVTRYMRAHFFGVEASQVAIRPGMEESIGLSNPRVAIYKPSSWK